MFRVITIFIAIIIVVLLCDNITVVYFFIMLVNYHTLLSNYVSILKMFKGPQCNELPVSSQPHLLLVRSDLDHYLSSTVTEGCG